MTKDSPWSFKKKISIILLIITIFFVVFIFLSIGKVSDFKALTRYETAEFNYREISEQTDDLLQDCYGFEGVCALDSLGVRLELVFHGIALKTPSPNFLNMSGWGDNRGWSIEKKYFGTRELKVISTDNQETASFTQSFWNTASYVSFDSLIAIDRHSSRLYVSSEPFGYLSPAIYERGWAVPLDIRTDSIE